MSHFWRPMEVLLRSVYTELGQLTAVLISAATAFNSRLGTSVGVAVLV
jgi:hypothetical protein